MADVRHAAPRRAFADRNGGGATSSQAIQLRKRSPCVYLLPPNRAQQPRKRHWMNVINIIAPCRYLDMWVFDDPRVGLQAEPFVGGADTMIDRVTVQIPDAEAGFVMIFSATRGSMPRPLSVTVTTACPWLAGRVILIQRSLST